MDTNDQSSENFPWVIEEEPDRLVLRHEHLWLGFFGIPFSVLSAFFGIGIWFIPGVPVMREWPIFVGGSVIALGFVVMGLHLTFNREEFIADRRSGKFEHISGFGPFTRRRLSELAAIERVICREAKRRSSFQEYEMVLQEQGRQRIVAVFVEKDVVLWEGLRWSTFLLLPFDDEIAPPKEKRSKGCFLGKDS